MLSPCDKRERTWRCCGERHDRVTLVCPVYCWDSTEELDYLCSLNRLQVPSPVTDNKDTNKSRSESVVGVGPDVLRSLHFFGAVCFRLKGKK